MGKVLKWIGIFIGGLVGLAVLTVIVLSLISNARLNKTYEINPAAVSIPNDAAALGRGAYLYASTCAGCHGDDLSGKAILDDPAIGYLPASNLTSGQGGVGSRYGDADFVRAIRHGVGYDGKALIIMPSKAFYYFSDEDLGAVIAFLKSAAPVNNDPGEIVLKPMGSILLAVGAFGDILSAEVIDHNAPRPAVPAQGVTVEYGGYLVKISDCINCHGEALSGGQSPEPGAPFSPNLTPGGDLATWTVNDFITAIRTGVKPDGNTLDAKFMPWKEFARKTDEDLTAIFLYLQSLAPTATATK